MSPIPPLDDFFVFVDGVVVVVDVVPCGFPGGVGHQPGTAFGVGPGLAMGRFIRGNLQKQVRGLGGGVAFLLLFRDRARGAALCIVIFCCYFAIALEELHFVMRCFFVSCVRPSTENIRVRGRSTGNVSLSFLNDSLDSSAPPEFFLLPRRLPSDPTILFHPRKLSAYLIGLGHTHLDLQWVFTL